MKKLNFEEYLNCVQFIENPAELYTFLKEDTDPAINEITDDNFSRFTKLIMDYMDQQITIEQQICIDISIRFGIPYKEVLILPKEVGAYLMAVSVAKDKEKKEMKVPIQDQIKEAKAVATPPLKISPEQIADVLRMFGIGTK